MYDNMAFDQWRFVYLLSAPSSAGRRRAIKGMKQSNASFDEWAMVHNDPTSDHNLKKVSLNEMTKKIMQLKRAECNE